MKKILVMAVMMLSSVAMFAQTEAGKLTVQPKVGMNIANLTDFEGSKSLVGLAAGAELEYGLTDMLSLSAGAMFSMQGAKYDTVEEGIKVEAKAKLNYLTVPVLANVYVAPGLAVKLGLQPAFKLSAKAKAEGAGVEVEQDIDGVKSMDLSVPVGVSYEFSNVVLDARYNWGITKADDLCKNTVFQITLGYKFAL